jgi:hypothetical protein
VETKSPQYKIYGWWSGSNRPPVLFFSTKVLGLEPTGPATERAIANVAVSGIAGYLSNKGSHEKGPQDCPNYYNPKRKLEVLTGRQKFCKPCAAQMRRNFPMEYTALNAILRAFD